MGRHRRSAAGRAAEGRATGVRHTDTSATGSDGPPDPYTRDAYTTDSYTTDSYTTDSYAQDPYTTDMYTQDPYALELYRRDGIPKGIAPYLNPEAYTGANPRARAYPFADGGGAGSGAGGGFTPGGDSSRRRRRKRAGGPVRVGLLGTAAAALLGTAAVATGVVPGLEHYRLGGGTDTGSDSVQAAGSPGNTATEQGGTSGGADRREGDAGAGRTATRPASPSPSASASASTSASPSATPSRTAGGIPAPRATASRPASSPSRTASKAPAASAAPASVSARSAAEAEVLRLVNQERSKVGCSPLTANSSLTRLAEAFSDDMAARGFFDHTDPDGKSPWDRASAAGISNLGGENIARGQADAQAVMTAWMNSPGHKANILNCDFKTLGVGAHLGTGGPWWTQDFGY
ncbi:CAP domain-containing protein [Streptomyces sp. NPDC088560]|uniref:CAP domain-containing protein n=1 Tax=Streptomyces sp. NPDC088560 TaxID=3365868 RepID=UPI0037FE0B4E